MLTIFRVFGLFSIWQKKDYSYNASMKRYLLLSFIFLILAMPVMLYFLPPAGPIQHLGQSYLNDKGFTSFTLKVESERAGEITIQLANAKKGSYIENIQLRYTPWSLLYFQVNAIHIENAELYIATDEEGIKLDNILLVEAAEESSEKSLQKDLRIPFNKLKFSNIMIGYSNLDNRFTTSISGHMNSKYNITDLHIEMPYLQQNSEQLLASMSLQAASKLTDSKLTSMIQLKDAGDLLAVTADLEHDLKATNGHITFTAETLSFTSGIAQPYHIVPMLRGIIGTTEGDIDIQGKVEWRGETHQADINIFFYDVNTNIANTPLTGINGAIHLDKLAPLSTTGYQEITISNIDIGVPVQGGKLAFDLEPSGILSVKETDWDWAGGTLRSKAFSLDMNQFEVQDLVFYVHDVQLNDLAILVLKDDVMAEGSLDGTIPIVVKDGVLQIDNGFLEAKGKGIIRYRPKQQTTLQNMDNESVNLLLQALDNFHYEVLRITLNSKKDRHLEVLLQLLGHNPDVLGGKAFKLNLNLQGKLGEIIERGLNLYNLPDTIGERVLEQLQ